MTDETDGTLVPVIPLRWTELGDTGVEVSIGQPRGTAYPVRYRTKQAEPAAKTTTVKRGGK